MFKYLLSICVLTVSTHLDSATVSPTQKPEGEMKAKLLAVCQGERLIGYRIMVVTTGVYDIVISDMHCKDENI
jgi:hypothetical protein